MKHFIFLASLLLISSASALQIQCSHSDGVSMTINGFDVDKLSSVIFIGENGTMGFLSIPRNHTPNSTKQDGLWHPGNILEM